MCQACYDEAGRPFALTANAVRAAILLEDLYSFAPMGGAMHIVTDDDNVEDGSIEWCMENAYRYSGAETTDEGAIELAVGLAFAGMTEDERWTALALFWGYTTNLWAPEIIERFDLPHGTVFTVRCDSGFSREVGSLVVLEGKAWTVTGWDDHRTAGGPSNGEVIALGVRRVDPFAAERAAL